MPIQEVEQLPEWMKAQLKDLAAGCAGSEGVISLSNPMAHALAFARDEMGATVELRRVGGVFHCRCQELVDAVNTLYGNEVVVSPPPPVDPNVAFEEMEVVSDVNSDEGLPPDEESDIELPDPNARVSPNTRVGNKPDHTPLTESEREEREEQETPNRTSRKTAPRPPARRPARR